jgi:hypothetical protein
MLHVVAGDVAELQMVITRLTTQWQDEHRAFMARDLSDRDYVYCWVDGGALQRASPRGSAVLPGHRGRAPQWH